MGQENSVHDFNDGKGPVPAHQHLNPDGSLGGWVAETAYVAPTCFVGPDAQVYDHAVVYDHANVFGIARIFSGAQEVG